MQPVHFIWYSTGEFPQTSTQDGPVAASLAWIQLGNPDSSSRLVLACVVSHPVQKHKYLMSFLP